MRTFLLVAVFLFLSPIVSSSDIYVPDDHVTIQHAINAAVDGDNVIVRPGEYVENINFLGKAITVISEWGPHVTSIDGNDAGSVVTFNSGEGTDSKLEGFTIMNGLSNIGAGIACMNGSGPAITHNVIRDNTVPGLYGGGICCDGGSSPVITNNTIKGNAAVIYGGGIHCNNQCNPRIYNNYITENSSGSGGGICAFYSDPLISSNIITNNIADLYGGGINCLNCGSIVVNNIISDNRSNAVGGGLCCDDSQMLVTHPLCQDSCRLKNSLLGGAERSGALGGAPA